MSTRKRNLPRGWYPVGEKECRREIESFLKGWSPPPGTEDVGRGGIVPHAGWYFSGKLAAQVCQVLTSRKEVDLVVLYGGHLGPEDLPHIVTEEHCESPLGNLEIDGDFVSRLMGKIETRKEHPSSGDNTVEVQLALIKYFFPKAKLVAVRSPFSVKAIRLGERVAETALETGVGMVAIGSTDLTHYGPNYGFVTKGIGPPAVKWVKEENDRGFVDLAIKMDGKGLLRHARENDSACSAGAAAAAIATCKAFGANEGKLLDYYTSYDVMPDSSFVGYAGIVF